MVRLAVLSLRLKMQPFSSDRLNRHLKLNQSYLFCEPIILLKRKCQRMHCLVVSGLFYELQGINQASIFVRFYVTPSQKESKLWLEFKAKYKMSVITKKARSSITRR